MVLTLSFSVLNRPKFRYACRVIGCTVLAFCLTFIIVAFPGSIARAAEQQLANSWVVSGNTASAVLGDGMVITAVYSGPAVMKGEGSYLRFDLTNCTDACGQLAYSFASPVSDVTLKVADIGARVTDSSSGTLLSYHNSPVTVREGRFTALEQSDRLGLSNNDSTLGILNPSQYLGPPRWDLPINACTEFEEECGVYSVQTAEQTISTLTFDFGYEGTGTNTDVFRLALAATPVPSASLNISTVSIGAIGTYSYTLSNLSHATDSVVTTMPGVMQSSGQRSTVLAAGSPVTVRPSIPEGQKLAGVVCKNLNQSPSPDPNVRVNLQDGSAIIPAENIPFAAMLDCVFTFEVRDAAPVEQQDPAEGDTPLPVIPPAPTVSTDLAQKNMNLPLESTRVEKSANLCPLAGILFQSCISADLTSSVEATPPTVEDEVRYRLEIANHGNRNAAVDMTVDLGGVLDDAQMLEPLSVEEGHLEIHPLSNGRYSVRGSLGAGAKASIWTAVRVRDDQSRGDSVLTARVRNADAPELHGICRPAESLCQSDPVKSVVVSIQSEKLESDFGEAIRITANVTNAGAVPLEPSEITVDLKGSLESARYQGDAPSGMDFDGSELTLNTALAPGSQRSVQFSLSPFKAGPSMVISIQGGRCGMSLAPDGSCGVVVSLPQIAATGKAGDSGNVPMGLMTVNAAPSLGVLLAGVVAALAALGSGLLFRPDPGTRPRFHSGRKNRVQTLRS